MYGAGLINDLFALELENRERCEMRLYNNVTPIIFPQSHYLFSKVQITPPVHEPIKSRHKVGRFL